MSIIISLLISGQESHLHIRGDIGECFLIYNSGVYSGIGSCGYLYGRREIVDVEDPIVFFKENEDLIRQISNSRRVIPSSMNKEARVLKIHLNEIGPAYGDFVLKFKSFSRSRESLGRLTHQVNHELAMSALGHKPWAGSWEHHAIPREHLESHFEKKRRALETHHGVEVLRRASNTWLPQEIEEMRAAREAREAALAQAEFERQQHLQQEYHRKFAEDSEKYNEAVLDFHNSREKRKLAKDPEQQFMHDLDFIAQGENVGPCLDLRDPFAGVSFDDSRRRVASDDF
jgi:hypothetical protein